MKVLLTGSRGQLGQAIIANKPDNIDIIATSRDSFDITSREDCEIFVKKNTALPEGKAVDGRAVSSKCLHF